MGAEKGTCVNHVPSTRHIKCRATGAGEEKACVGLNGRIGRFFLKKLIWTRCRLKTWMMGAMRLALLTFAALLGFVRLGIFCPSIPKIFRCSPTLDRTRQVSFSFFLSFLGISPHFRHAARSQCTTRTIIIPALGTIDESNRSPQRCIARTQCRR